MTELLQQFVQHGFSVVVAAYLLVRMESRLDALTEAIRRLQAVLEAGMFRSDEAASSAASRTGATLFRGETRSGRSAGRQSA
jgi:hypothetical protein